LTTCQRVRIIAPEWTRNGIPITYHPFFSDRIRHNAQGATPPSPAGDVAPCGNPCRILKNAHAFVGNDTLDSCLSTNRAVARKRDYAPLSTPAAANVAMSL
jgi:hypothetical protein